MLRSPNLARVVTIDVVTADAFRVSTFPPIGGIDRRFVGRDGFAEALELAGKAAAGLGYRLIDRTGRLTEAECTSLVEARAHCTGAEIIPLAARR